MARAYSYIRFSTPEQAAGDSFRRQTEKSEAYAKANGLRLDDSLDMHDKGLSAFTGANKKKGGLAVFLKAVETGIVRQGSYLLVESLDRLSRDTLTEQMTLFMQLVNSDITVVTLTDKQVYNKDTINTDISRLMLSLVMMMRAHEESSTKSERLVQAWIGKRQKISQIKMTSQCPQWLVLSEDRKSFGVILERAQIVRRIFDMNIAGKGQATIAKQLNREGVPAWGKSNGWHFSYIQRILRSRTVLGEYQPRRRERQGKRRLIDIGEPIKEYYPAVIDQLTWQKAQVRKQTNTPGQFGQSTGNLFSGLAFDGNSGTPMRHMGRGYDKKKREKKDGTPYRYYYLVSDYTRKQPDARAVTWRYDWFEKWFLDYIIQVDWAAISREKIPITEIGFEKKLADVRAKIDQIQTKLDRLTNLAASTNTPPVTLIRNMTELETQLVPQKAKELELAKEYEALVVRRTSLQEAGTEIKDLVAQGDKSARLRLREELRKRISRIDLFPEGADAKHLEDEPVKPEIMTPTFKVTYVNGVYQWFFCNSRKPEPDGAVILNSAPPSGMQVELQERPEVSYTAGIEADQRGKVLTQRYVPIQTKRTKKTRR